MKLSEAMRKGAAATLPTEGFLCDLEMNATCALGATLLGAGLEMRSIDAIDRSHTPVTYMERWFAAQGMPVDKQVKHPVAGYEDRLSAVIASLNDSCDWSREQIADWLEEQGL